MAEENTPNVEPEEFDLDTAETGSQQDPAAPQGGAAPQAGDDETDDAMDAIARDIGDDGTPPGENIASFGAVHTGSRDDREPTSGDLPVEGRNVAGPEVGRSDTPREQQQDPQTQSTFEVPRGEREGGEDRIDAAVPNPPLPDIDPDLEDDALPQAEIDLPTDQQQAATNAAPQAAQQAQPGTPPTQAADGDDTTEPTDDGGNGDDGTTPDGGVDTLPASVPALTVTGTQGVEDTTFPLDLTSLLGGTGTLTVIVSGLPDGASLSAGTLNPDGSWTLTADQLDGLTITPPLNYSGTFDLTIRATSTGAGGDTATLNTTVGVFVEAVADAPTLSATATAGTEDTAAAVDITSALTDTDGSEVLSLTITGVPDGASLSAGTRNPDGSWSLTPDQLPGLTLTPPPGFSGTITLGVTSTSTEQSNNDAASVSTTVSVTFGAVADTPTLSVSAASGLEDTAIGLDVRAALTDTDGSEVLSITIAGVPDGGTLSAGTRNGDGTWTLTPDQLPGLTFTPPLHSDGDVTLTITATSREPNGSTATTSAELPVTVAAVADAPTLPAATASGIEDTAIPLNLSAALVDTDGSESLSVTISGVPTGAFLSAGTDNGDGTWTLTAEQLNGLTITPPSDSDVDFNLTVTATTTEAENGDTATTTITVPVQVVGDADLPTLDLDSSTPTVFDNARTLTLQEDERVALDISAAITDIRDTDNSERLEITLSGIPDGAKLLTAAGAPVGTSDGNGNWVLHVDPAKGIDELDGLIFVPTSHSDADITIGVSVQSIEREGNTSATVTGEIKLIYDPVANGVTIASVQSAGGPEGITGEHDRIALNLTVANLPDDDGSETITLNISDTGLPPDTKLFYGANEVENVNGTWTLKGLTRSDLGDLSVLAPEDFAGDFKLTVRSQTVEERGDNSGSPWSTHEVVVTVTPRSDGVTGKDVAWTVQEDNANPNTHDYTGGNFVTLDPVRFSLNDVDRPDDSESPVSGVETVTGVTFYSNDAAIEGSTWKFGGSEYSVVKGTFTVNGVDYTYKVVGQDGAGFTATTVDGVAWSVGGVAFKPDADSDTPDAPISLAIAVETQDTTVYDEGGSAPSGTSAVTTTVLNGSINVQAVTDDLADFSAPRTISWTEDKNQDTNSHALNVTLTLGDTDLSESATQLVISGVPAGWSLIGAGIEKVGNDWVLTGEDLNALRQTNSNVYDLSSLKVVVPDDTYGSATLTAQVTWSDRNPAADRSDDLKIDINVDAFADGVTLTVAQPAAVNEGLSGSEPIIDLGLGASLADADGSETITVQISSTDLPAGTQLFNGTTWLNLPTGQQSWTLEGMTPSELTALKLKVTTDYAGDFTLSVDARSVESDGTTSGGWHDHVDVPITVSPLSDGIVVHDTQDAKIEHGWHTDVQEDGSTAFQPRFTLNDTDDAPDIGVEKVTGVTLYSNDKSFADATWTFDGAEQTVDVGSYSLNGQTFTYRLTLPEGGHFTATDESKDEWQLNGLRVAPKGDSDTDIPLTMAVTTEDTTTLANGPQTSVPHTTVVEGQVSVKPVTDDLTTFTVPETIAWTEDQNQSTNSHALDIALTLGDVDMSETAERLVISGVPEEWTLSGSGIEKVDGTWVLDASDLATLRRTDSNEYDLSALRVTLPEHADTDGPVTLNVTTYWADHNGAIERHATQPIKITVTGKADGFRSLTINGPAAATERIDGKATQVELNLDATLIDTDGSETVSLRIEAGTDLPAGTTLFDGSTWVKLQDLGNGVKGWEISGLKQHDTHDDLGALKVRVDTDYAGDFNLRIQAKTVEKDGDDTEWTALQNLVVRVAPRPDTVKHSDMTAETDEDAAVAYTPIFQLTDTDAAGVEHITGITITSNGTETERAVMAPGTFDANGQPTGNGAYWYTLAPNGTKTYLTVTATNDGHYSLTVPMSNVVDAGNNSVQIQNLYFLPSADSSLDAKVKVHVTTSDTATYELGTPSTESPTRTQTFDGEITVKPVADPVTLSDPHTISRVEDAFEPVSLGLSAALTDTDGSEKITSVVLEDVPEGWTILGNNIEKSGNLWVLKLPDGGADNDAVQAILDTLKADVPENVAGTHTITMRVGWSDTDSDSDDATVDVATPATTTVTLSITPVADTPDTLVVKDAAGYEDTAIALYIRGVRTDLDGSEYLKITITGVPDKASLSAGTDNHDGTWTLIVDPDGVLGSVRDDTANLTITPPANSNEDFQLHVTVVGIEGAGGTPSDPREADINVSVTGIADGTAINPPMDDAGQVIVEHTVVGAVEDTAVALGIEALAGTDTDGSESLTYVIDISQLPAGFTLTGVADKYLTALNVEQTRFVIGSDGDKSLAEILKDIKLSPPDDYSASDPDATAPVSVRVEVRATENDGDTRIEAHDFKVDFAATTDKPTLTVTTSSVEDAGLTFDSEGNPTSPVSVDVTYTARQGDSRGEETIEAIWVKFDDAPGVVAIVQDGQTISPDSDGWYKLAADGDTFTLQVDGTTWHNQAGSSAPIDMDFRVTVKDGDDTESYDFDRSVTLTPDADTPTLAVNDTSGVTGQPLALDLTAALTDTDGSETLSLRVEGMVDGAVLVTGDPNNPTVVGQNLGNGVWLVSSQDLATAQANGGLQVWSPYGKITGYDEHGVPISEPLTNLTLTVTAVATETENSDTASTSATINLGWTGDGTGSGDYIYTPGWEDSTAQLDFSQLLDADAQNDSYTLTGVTFTVPEGAVVLLGDGTTKTGEITLTLEQMQNARVGWLAEDLAKRGIDIDLEITPQGTTEGSGSLPQTISYKVDIRPIVDEPFINEVPLTADEGAGVPLASLAPELGDLDGSEILTVIVELPTITVGDETIQLRPSVGQLLPDGRWLLQASDIDTAKIVTPSYWSGTFDIKVTAVATEQEGGQYEKDITVKATVNPVANGPEISGGGTVGEEDAAAGTGINLGLSVSLPDASESLLSLTLDQLTTGQILLDGTVLLEPNGSVTLTQNGADVVDGQGHTYTNTTIADLAAKLTLRSPDEDFSGQISVNVSTSTRDVGDASGLPTDEATQAPHTVTVVVTPEADVPTLAFSSGTASEDTPIAVTITAAANDDSEDVVIFLTLPKGAVPLSLDGDVPSVVGRNIGSDSDTVTFLLDPADLQGLHILPPKNASGEMDITVRVVSREMDDRDAMNSSEQTFTIDVAGVADAPDLEPPEQITGLVEDDQVIVDLGLTLQDADRDPDTDTGDLIEQLTITLKGMPLDSTFSAKGADGTLHTLTWSVDDEATGTVSFTGESADLLTSGDLVITLPDNYGEDFILQVKAETDEGGTTAASRGEVDGEYAGWRTVAIEIAPEADAPDDLGAADVTSTEGTTAIPLGIQGTFADTDGSEVHTVVITGVPEGCILNGATRQADGSWLVTNPEDLASVTLTAPPTFSGELTLTVQATATETETGDTDSATHTFSVRIAPDAQTPSLTVTNPADVAEDDSNTGPLTVPLTIDATTTDTDGSETVAVVISGLPTGASLTAGEDNGDGTWTVSGDQLDGLGLKLPEHFSGSVDLTVKAVSTDTANFSTGTVTDTAESATQTLHFEVTADADTPTDVGASPDSGSEGSTGIALNLSATFADGDGSEVHELYVIDVPDGFSLTHATPQSDGTWLVHLDYLADVTLRPPEHFAGEVNLKVRAVATEQSDPTNPASVTQSFTVTIAPEADAPSLTVSPVTEGLVEDQGNTELLTVPLDLTLTAGGTDPSEVLSVQVTGLPDGAKLSAGSEVDGTWTVDAGDLDDLSLTLPDGFSGSVSLSFTPVSTDTEGAPADVQQGTPQTLQFEVAPLADAPIITEGGAIAADQAPVDLNVGVTKTDADESLAVTISYEHGTVLDGDGNTVASGTTFSSEDDLAKISGLQYQLPSDATNGTVYKVTLTAETTDGSTTANATAVLSIQASVAQDPEGASTITGTLIDPYISGATVFLDLDGDGVMDADEPSTVTDAMGGYSFDGVDADAAAGAQLVAFGGVDTGTGLPLDGVLTGQAGGTITPLTTLMQAAIDDGLAGSGDEAQAWVAQVMDLPLAGIDLTDYDPVAQTAAGDPVGAEVLRAGMMVQTTVSMLTSAVEAAAVPPQAGTPLVMQAVVETLNSGGIAGLTAGATGLTQHLADALTAEGLIDGEQSGVFDAVTAAVAETNQAFLDQSGSGPELIDALTATARDGVSTADQAVEDWSGTAAPDALADDAALGEEVDPTGTEQAAAAVDDAAADQDTPEQEANADAPDSDVPESDTPDGAATDGDATQSDAADAPLTWDAFLTSDDSTVGSDGDAQSGDAGVPDTGSGSDGAAGDSWDAFLSPDAPQADGTAFAEQALEVDSVSQDGGFDGSGVLDGGDVVSGDALGGLSTDVSVGEAVLPDSIDGGHDHSIGLHHVA